MSTESAAGLTRSIIQVEAFIPQETEALVRASAEQTGVNLSVEENVLHVNMLRLIATERRRERAAAWAEMRQQNDAANLPDRTAWNFVWNADWQFTDARREHVMRQYPLQIRAAGRTVMAMVSGQQIDGRGQRLATPAGEAMELIPFSRVTSGHSDEPYQLARHLRLSGLHADGRTRPGGNFSEWQYPSEARNYLRVYPVAPGFGEGEMDRQQMRSFGASDNLLNRIIRERGIYPVPRMFEGRGGREVEGFTGHDVDIINYEVRSMEMIHDDEITLRELYRHLGTQKLGEEAVLLSGAPNHYRRLPGQGRGHCIRLRSTTRVINTYNWMVTLQPGEAGADELANLLGLDPIHMRTFITNADQAHGRDIYPTQKGPRRRVFPPAIVRQIMKRVEDRLKITADIPEVFPQYRPPKRQIEPLWTPADKTDQEAWTPPAPAEIPDTAAVEEVAEETRRHRRRTSASAIAGAVVLAETIPVITAESASEEPVPAAVPDVPEVETLAAAAEVPEAPEIPEASEAPEPQPPEWRTYANLASILRVPLGELTGRIRLAQPKAHQIESRFMPNGDYKPHVHPDVAAQAAYAVLRQRHERMPSVQFTTLQIAVLVGRHPADVAQRIRQAQIARTNHAANENAAYGRDELDQILNLFGVSF
jgi:hypothetical protein